MPDKLKTCSKCGETKPFEDYYKQTDCAGGYRPDCKECVRDRIREARKADLQSYRERDRTRNLAPTRKDQMREAGKRRYAKDPEGQRAARRAHYALNSERWTIYRRRREARKAAVEHQPYTREEIFDRDAGTCRGCAKLLPYEKGAFQIDHIVPISLGGPDTPANVQIMCPSCNRAKWANLEGQIHLPV